MLAIRRATVHNPTVTYSCVCNMDFGALFQVTSVPVLDSAVPRRRRDLGRFVRVPLAVDNDLVVRLELAVGPKASAQQGTSS